MSINWDKVKIEADLVSLPDIYWRLRDVIDGGDFAMQDVADLIGCDPGLTARMLRMVNSAYFGFSSSIETVAHAISIVGVRQVEELVLTTSVADALGDYQCEHFDVKQFWVRSIYRAICARRLAADCNVINNERLFVTGLLSGVGHLIMYRSMPILAQQAQNISDETGRPLQVVEREIVGFDHATIGSLLLENWKLPASQVEAIRNHLEPDPAADYFLETAITHIAALIGNAVAESRPVEECFIGVDPRTWDVTGLEVYHCVAMQNVIAEQLTDIVGLLFPKMKLATG